MSKNYHIINLIGRHCWYWKYSPWVVKISFREAQPQEVIFDHKRWIFPISTFQIVDIHIIHNFMPPCSRLKWELKKKPKKSIFSKSMNIYLHCVPGVSGLGQKYAFIKKSIIFTRSLRNFVKMRPSCVPSFVKVSQWLSKNCGIFNKSIFLT